jgi:hypothetical protein
MMIKKLYLSFFFAIAFHKQKVKIDMFPGDQK